MPRFHLRPTLAATICLVAGLLLFKFGSGHLRGFGSDVLVVVFLTACVAGVGVGGPRSRPIGVLVFAVVVECIQALHLVGPDSHWFLHLTLGSTFDPLDLLAYVIGAAAAVGGARLWVTPGTGQASPPAVD
jgi:hypothetical protein